MPTEPRARMARAFALTRAGAAPPKVAPKPKPPVTWQPWMVREDPIHQLTTPTMPYTQGTAGKHHERMATPPRPLGRVWDQGLKVKSALPYGSRVFNERNPRRLPRA